VQGLAPAEADRVAHLEKICDKIVNEIRGSQFVVADVSQHKPGVYFEAGFAMALNRPVIWTCREEDFDLIHFDTRQYNHIKWRTPDDLRQQLADRILATIGERPTN
jgi:nucleoside 2-deoxyribosyltransferase